MVCLNFHAQLFSLIYSPVSESVAVALLYALIPMGDVMLAKQTDMATFPELMMIMHTLAGVGKGKAHSQLFQAATHWLDLW